jgi:hypothetical protein
MPLTNFDNGITSFGIPVLGGGGPFTTGNVFFVGSTVSSAVDSTSAGKGPDVPFATIDYAIGQCTANNGDVIIAMPGHSETISAAGGITADVAGVSIIGVGRGDDRPTISFTATASTYVVSAASHRLENVILTGDIDAVATMFSISAADCELINIETRDVTGQMTSCITTAAGADRLLIDGYVHRGAAAAGGANCLELDGANDGVTVRNFWIDGNFSTSAIVNGSGTMTNLSIYGDRQSYVRNRNSADVIFTAVATTTGNFGPNVNCRIADNAANIDEAIVGADMQFYGPIQIVNLDGESSFVSAVGTYNAGFTASTDA